MTLAATVFAANVHMGTWKLDESKSKFSPGSPKNTTVSYTEAKNDMIKLTVDGVDKDGKSLHWTWTGRFDGKSYKIKGSASADQMAFKTMNDHTNELTVMKDGKVTMTGVIKVAKDGKTRTVTSTVTDAEGKKQTDKAYYSKE